MHVLKWAPACDGVVELSSLEVCSVLDDGFYEVNSIEVTVKPPNSGHVKKETPNNGYFLFWRVGLNRNH